MNKQQAEAFFQTKDCCNVCRIVGASCGQTSGKDCFTTLAAMNVWADAEFAERVAKVQAKQTLQDKQN